MQLTTNYILSQIFTILMYISLGITFFSTNRTKILFLNLVSYIMIGIAFFLLSAHTGLAMVFLGIIRTITFMIDEKINGTSDKIKGKDIVILIFLTILAIILTIPAYSGILSLLPVFATYLSMISVWQKKTSIYKILSIPISVLLIFYSIYISSIFGVICESIMLILSINGFILEIKSKRKGIMS